MTETGARYERVGGRFTACAHAVVAAGWDNPTPCEGWVARDILAHLNEWVWSFPLAPVGLQRPPRPSGVDVDPRREWDELDAAIRAALADPEVAARELDTPLGRVTLEAAIEMFVIPDLLIHTWDLARATRQDETLDPDEVRSLLATMLPMDRALRESGHYGPAVAVPADADEQTKLLAFTGRRP